MKKNLSAKSNLKIPPMLCMTHAKKMDKKIGKLTTQTGVYHEQENSKIQRHIQS